MSGPRYGDDDHLDGMDAFYPFDDDEAREHDSGAHQETEAEWLDYVDGGES